MNISSVPLRKPLILVVDDDKFMRLQLCRAMEQAGYQVAAASDGQQALTAYVSLHPNIVLLDALMPVIDGFACCSQLQALPSGDSTPILMITALEDQESVDRAFAAGATDYITKPIHWAVLRQRVSRLLETSWMTEELRQQTERAQASEARLRLALDAAQMGTWDWDMVSGKVTYSANAAANLGLAPIATDSNYRSFLNSLHPEDRQSVIAAVRCAVAEGADYDIEYRVLWPDGNVRWVATKGQVYYDTTGKAERMIGISMDITERKQTQEQLQRQNHRAQLFAEVTLKIRQSLQIQEILQTTVTEVQKLLQADRVLIYRLWSDGSGCVITEAVVPGWPVVLDQTFPTEVFPDDYRHLYTQGRIRKIEDIETAEVPSCLVEFLQQWGVKAKLVVPILLKAELWGLLIAHQCVRSRQWSSFEIELLQQLADQVSISLAQAQLLEQEILQRQELARSNAELQQFALIASHDLQEPLRKIQAFGNRLKDKFSEELTEQGRDYLERMHNAAERMHALIDDLLTLSRVTTRAQPFVPVNLVQVTHEVLSDLEVFIQQTGGLVEVGELPTIDADPVQIRQLLQNLISNALKFHRAQEPPLIRISSQLFVNQEKQLSEDAVGAELCQITIEDNGIGFDEKYLDRIFNVFQRLHNRSEYEGTGMGLAICRKIVERHGGNITAKSIPHQGATFIVTMPIKQRRGDAE